jgi:hypothetical protein
MNASYVWNTQHDAQYGDKLHNIIVNAQNIEMDCQTEMSVLVGM